MKPARMSLPTRGWEKRCAVSVISVCKVLLRYDLCRDVKKNGQKKPIFAGCVFIFFIDILLFAAAHCFRSLPNQLTHNLTNKPLKGGRAGSASRFDSNLFVEG